LLIPQNLGDDDAAVSVIFRLAVDGSSYLCGGTEGLPSGVVVRLQLAIVVVKTKFVHYIRLMTLEFAFRA
jgi:hypothetical protein